MKKSRLVITLFALFFLFIAAGTALAFLDGNTHGMLLRHGFAASKESVSLAAPKVSSLNNLAAADGCRLGHGSRASLGG